MHRKKDGHDSDKLGFKMVKESLENAPELILVTFLAQIVIVHKEIWIVLEDGFSNLKPSSNGPQGGFSGPCRDKVSNTEL